MNPWTNPPRPRADWAILFVIGLAIVALALQPGCQSRPTSDPRDPEVFRPHNPVFPTP